MAAPEELQLGNGPLRFSALAQGQGPVVLMLHGFPDTQHSWKDQLDAFAAAGYRAVAVAMRGYEPGSLPEDGDYSLESLASDVMAWVEQLGADRVHLVGHDWGAAVAYTVGRDYPERVLSLTTMAVPHSGRFLSEVHRYPRQLRLSWYMGFFQLRGIADRVVRRKQFAFLRKLWRDWSPGWDFTDADFQPVIDAFSQPGVVRGALGYYRAIPGAMPLGSAARAETRWKIDVPTLALTGAEDGCIDTEVFRSLMYEEDFPSGLRVEQVADAGHFPHLEQPDVVNELLLSWFADHSGAVGG